MRVNTYAVLSRAIGEGIAAVYEDAKEQAGGSSVPIEESALYDSIMENVMEVFNFDDDDNEEIDCFLEDVDDDDDDPFANDESEDALVDALVSEVPREEDRV